jgi:hypothetical protein
MFRTEWAEWKADGLRKELWADAKEPFTAD